MRSVVVSLMLLVLLVDAIAARNSKAEDANSTDTPAASAAIAERFFRSEYDGKPTVIDELASEKLIVSYPIFEEVYGKVALRGKDDVKDLCAHFARKWVDRQLDIREVIVDDNKVVIVWGIEARFVKSENDEPSKPVHWAGISIYYLDENGKIEKEYGLESQPGPFSELLVGELTDNMKR